MNKIIKITYNNLIKAYQDKQITFDKLTEYIKNSFPELNDNKITLEISYKDSDGDQVAICSDLDLISMLESTEKSVKILVTKVLQQINSQEQQSAIPNEENAKQQESQQENVDKQANAFSQVYNPEEQQKINQNDQQKKQENSDFAKQYQLETKCAYCQKPIVGTVKYVCKQCIDFCYCEECQKDKVHMHPLEKIEKIEKIYSYQDLFDIQPNKELNQNSDIINKAQCLSILLGGTQNYYLELVKQNPLLSVESLITEIKEYGLKVKNDNQQFEWPQNQSVNQQNNYQENLNKDTMEKAKTLSEILNQPKETFYTLIEQHPQLSINELIDLSNQLKYYF